MEHNEDSTNITSLKYHGSDGGNPFDDGVYSTIKRFVIHHREWICSIQIEYYDRKGDSIWSSKHGGKPEGSKAEIVLDSPEEYITSIHGYYGDIDKWGIKATVIRSLSLETNKKKYGPFGIEEGTKFKFPTKGVKKIVGFHGRCGWYLDAIGLHVETTQGMVHSSGSFEEKICHCGKKVILVTSRTSDNPSRRFLGCANYWDGGGCNYFKWYDNPICERGKDVINEQAKNIKTLEDKLQQYQQNERFKKHLILISWLIIASVLLVSYLMMI